MELDKFYKLFITQGFKYTTDSRNIPRGAIFFALKGANFNGNAYAIQAIKDGASYAVVDEEVGHDIKLIKVDNVLRFMQQVANMHRRAFDIPVIGIGGSNGKTTTKNLVESVLSQSFKTHVTKGNFNNHIGVPMTLLDLPQDTEVAIVELGTNHPGEIRDLARIVEPTHAVITNIGKEHLEGFGTLEAVAKEESELYHYIHRTDGHAFINADDPWLTRMSRAIEHKTLYSIKDIEVSQVVPSISFVYKGLSVNSPLMGDYNLENILTAIAIGNELGLQPVDIVNGIEAYIPDNNRSQLIERGAHLVWMDAYNANPTSMEKAISNFALVKERKKVLVLGDMFEMGKQSLDEHKALLEYISNFDFAAVHLIGKDFGRVASPFGFTHHEDVSSLKSALAENWNEPMAFLLKGSRGMRLEEVLDSIG